MNVQYQRPGLQIQVANGNGDGYGYGYGQPNPNAGMLCAYFPNMCQPLIPVAYAHPGPKVQVQQQATVPPVVPMTREYLFLRILFPLISR